MVLGICKAEKIMIQQKIKILSFHSQFISVSVLVFVF